jgi:hypothetical protein
MGEIRPAPRACRVFSSGSNHRENHLEPLERLEGVRLLRGHEYRLAALQLVSLAGNHNLDFAFEHMHEGIEWRRMLA